MNKWIMLISIISVALMIIPSIGVASEAGLFQEPPREEPIISDSGSIVLEDTAEGNLDSGTGINPSINPIDDSTGVEDDSGISGGPSGNSIENEDPLELDKVTNEEPESDKLIYLVVNGDEDLPLKEDSEDTDLTWQDVDEVFVASDDGVVDGELFIGTNLSLNLNIVGHVEINVLYGSENLSGDPYFDGYDVFDNTAFAIITSSVMLALTTAKLLRQFGKPIMQSVQFGMYVTAQVLDAILNYILTGDFYLYIDFSDGGLGGPFTFEGKILKAIIDSLVEPILKFIQTDFEISLSDIIPSIKEALENDEFESVIGKFITGDIPLRAGVSSIIKRLQGMPYYSDDEPDIYDWLTDNFDLSDSQAKQAISFLQTSENALTNLRINTIGKFDIFLSEGKTGINAIKLRNLHAEINSDSEPDEQGYVAKIQIKAISAGQVFDSKIIGIK